MFHWFILLFAFSTSCLQKNTQVTWIDQFDQEDCPILFEGIDLKTKMYKKELAPAKLFNYTPRQIRNELPSSHLIECTGQIVKVENDVYLNINLALLSQKAHSQYGSIKKDFLLRLILIDGKVIETKCRTGSVGVQTQSNGFIIYPLSYALSKRDIRSLGHLELDKIGIQWDSGYEEYTIYEIDFFINQLACLNRQDPKRN